MIREYVLESLPIRAFMWFRGQTPTRAIIDLSKNPSGVAVVSHRYGVHVPEPSATQLSYASNHLKVEAIQAAAPGDNAFIDGVVSGRGGLSAPALNALNKAPMLPDTEVGDAPMLPAAPLIRDAGEAWSMQKPDAWPIGQNHETGEIAFFDPKRHVHAGIVGATGTGKTKGAAFTLLCHAIAADWHAVILDPDEGEDWSRFAGVAEWHAVSRDTLPELVAGIYADFERRAGIPQEEQRQTLIVIDEYGDLLESLRVTNKPAAALVDQQIDSVFQRGRKRGVHLAVIDQDPGKWPAQVVSGTAKFTISYQLGPNRGATVGMYKAGEPGYLADVGEFLFRGTKYRSWDADVASLQVIDGAPRLNGYRMIDGVRDDRSQPTEGGSSPEVPPSPLVAVNGMNGASVSAPAKWQDFTDQWFCENPQYISEPYGGISALARAMAENDGGGRPYTDYKSTAKQYFDEFRAGFEKWADGTTKE